MRRGFVDGPDGQIFYREAGKGTPLVLLHQILRTSLDYEYVIPILAERFRVLAFDNAGCGDSDAPPHAYSMEEHAGAIAAAMDGLGVSGAAIVGHHSGANQALELALRRPELAARIVMSGLFYVDDPREREALRAKAVKLTDHEPRADGSHLVALWQEGLRTNWGKQRFPADRTDLLTKFLLEQLKTGSRRFEPYVALMDYDTRSRLPLLKVPCFFIKASDDVAMCAGAHLWTRDRPEAKLIEIPVKFGGEMPRLNAPQWSAAVLDLLRPGGSELPPPSGLMQT